MSVTTEIFVARAKEVHGNRYDYSPSHYENSDKKINVKCRIHGIFSVYPIIHTRPNACHCPKCAIITRQRKRKLKLSVFLERAKKIHGDKYDYSQTFITNCNTDVTIGCPFHGFFTQRPSVHLKGMGCKKCGTLVAMEKITKPPEDFLIEANKKFNNKFTYFLENYTKRSNVVGINCPRHGLTCQKPTDHLRSKNGCAKCAGNFQYKTEDFIRNAVEVHGNIYDYTFSKYIDSNTEIKIKCNKHETYFYQLPGVHVNMGSGCPDCGRERIIKSHTMTKEEFLERAFVRHNNFYSYDDLEWSNASTLSKMTCPVHGTFLQKPSAHLSGKGCQKCGGSLPSNTEDFILKSRKIHGELYGYDNVNYTKAHGNVDIECSEHGIFTTSATSHLGGHGCPKCYNKTEAFLHSILDEVFPEYTILYQVVVVSDGKLKIDFAIPELNLYIELDGKQHFIQVSNWQAPEYTQAHDLTKTMRVLEEGQSLVRIYQPWVASDTNNWLDKLKANIREYENPTAVFIGPEGTYDKHKKDLHFSKLSNKLYETKMVY